MRSLPRLPSAELLSPFLPLPQRREQYDEDISARHRANRGTAAAQWRDISLALRLFQQKGQSMAAQRGLVLMDIAMFWLASNQLMLIDEIHTRPTVRVMPAEDLKPNSTQTASKEFMQNGNMQEGFHEKNNRYQA